MLVDRQSRSIALRFLCAALLLGSGGCATGGGSKARLELARFTAQLAGLYDNHSQAAAQPSLAEAAVSIQPAYAPALGKQVFYVHESAANDARRVISQRLVAIELDAKGRIAQRDWVFTDVLRWRTAREQPDLFKSLIMDDVREVPPRRLRLDGDELLLQVAPGESASELRLERRR